MGAVDENKFPKLILQEIAADGSDLSNPAADHRSLFLGEDGLLHLKDSAGAVTDVGGTGGALAHSYVGYDTVGASDETVGANYKAYAKQFTLAADSLVASIDTFLKGASNNGIGGPLAAVYTDNAGHPEQPLALAGPDNSAVVIYIKTVGQWIRSGIGAWLPAGTYWAVVRLADGGGSILPVIPYDAGTDETLVVGAAWPNWAGATVTARKYSIRVSILS